MNEEQTNTRSLSIDENTPSSEIKLNASQIQDSSPLPPAAPTESQSLIEIDAFAAIDLRVGKVLTAEKLPKSKKLLKLHVDLGVLGSRQILSGISQFYTPEDLIGKSIIVVANLKPAKLMGEESHGMLLAGSTEGDAILAVIEPHESLPPGTRVR